MRRELKGRLALVFLAVLPLAVGCRREQAATGQDYTLRAMVVHAPDPASPVPELYLYHEAIDAWMGRSGKVEGMDPMSMPFLVAKGVSLEGIQARDKVEVTLHVDWEAERSVEITRIRELPPDTELVFRAAQPPRIP